VVIDFCLWQCQDYSAIMTKRHFILHPRESREPPTHCFPWPYQADYHLDHSHDSFHQTLNNFLLGAELGTTLSSDNAQHTDRPFTISGTSSTGLMEASSISIECALRSSGRGRSFLHMTGFMPICVRFSRVQGGLTFG
jgi:hypothetical protein